MRTGERTGAAKLKWVVIVDEALSPGQAVNAAVCVAAATAPGVPGLLGPGGSDASEHWHPGLPWAGCSILAASPAQLAAVRQQAIERQLLAADMPASAQATRVYDDYLRELAKTEPGDLAPLAVSLIGPRNQVAKKWSATWSCCLNCRWSADMIVRMSSQQEVQVPPRYARVNAWVISRDTDAEVQWLAAVFGAAETPGSRILDADGDIGHVEVEVGDSVIMLFDAKPGWPPTPAHLRIYVGDVAAAVEQAVAAGARVVTQPTMLAFGERVARVRDPQGHLWWLHEHVEDVAPEELASRFADPAAQEAMAYVQRTLREELAGH